MAARIDAARGFLRRAGHAALLAVLVLGTAGPAGAMRMTVEDDRVFLSGPVNFNDAVNFETLIDEHGGKIKTVVFRNSPGGETTPAYRITTMIRRLGLNTAASGSCVSACSIMFMGGVQRQLTDELPIANTYIGIHAARSSQTSFTAGHQVDLIATFMSQSDGKMDKDFIVTATKTRDITYVFHPELLKRKDRNSVVFCPAKDDGNGRLDRCQKLPGRNGLDLGIFTSAALVKIPRTVKDTRFVVGTVFEKAIDFESGIKAPLPDGQWTVALYGERKNNLDKTIQTLYLVDPSENALRRYLKIEFSNSTTSEGVVQTGGYAANKECERTNVLHVAKVANEIKKQECWYINHLVDVVPAFKKLSGGGAVLDAFQETGRPLPNTVVQVWTRFANDRNALDVSVYVDPASDGIQPAPDAKWADSAWHHSRFAEDPAKSAFVDRLKAWGEPWRQTVKAGFEGRLN